MSSAHGVGAPVRADLALTDVGLVFTVHPRWHKPRCGPGYDRRGQRYWQHLAVGSTVLWLCYAPWRVACHRCGVTVEQVPWSWSRRASRITQGLEELIAYLARAMGFTAIRRLLGLSWRAVAAIVARMVAERVPDTRLSRLRAIEVDEFPIASGHRYRAAVVDHDRGEAVLAAKGRGVDALAALFAHFGEAGCAASESVTMDMAGGYKKAVREHPPHARFVFDRFHVPAPGQ